jgi:hypothetical protein
VTTDWSPPLWAAQTKVVFPQAICLICQPLSSMYILGYMVVSPEAFSLPQAHSWSPIMHANEEVEPHATCTEQPRIRNRYHCEQ